MTGARPARGPAPRSVTVPTPPRRARAIERFAKPAIWILCLLPALLLGWNLWLAVEGRPNSLGAEPVEKLQQETGEWALRFLALALAVTPARRLLGWSWALRYRRMLGLFAFFYAALHLANFIGLDHFFALGDIAEDIFERPWITIGMVSFLLLVPLAITSTKGWIRRLGGRRWNRLHQLVYLAAAGGTLHFLLAVKKDLREPFIYAALFAALLGVRLWWRVADRRRRAAGAHAT